MRYLFVPPVADRQNARVLTATYRLAGRSMTPQNSTSAVRAGHSAEARFCRPAVERAGQLEGGRRRRPRRGPYGASVARRLPGRPASAVTAGAPLPDHGDVSAPAPTLAGTPEDTNRAVSKMTTGYGWPHSSHSPSALRFISRPGERFVRRARHLARREHSVLLRSADAGLAGP